MRILVVIAISAMVLSANAFAQSVDFGPDRSSFTVPTGTAVVRGHVVAAADRHALAHATVRMLSESSYSRGDATDEHGAFEITGLPAGRFELSVELNGYVSLGLGESSFAPPRLLDISDGEVRSDIEIALPRGGVIEVHVTDESGAPVEGANVRAERPRASKTGEIELAMFMGDTQGQFGTDDLGVIRLFGLRRGTYYVSATPTGAFGEPRDVGRLKSRRQTFYPSALTLSDAEPVIVEPGEEIRLDVVIAKPFAAVQHGPAGAITVHVTDDAGNPFRDAEVRALEVTHDDGRWNVQRARSPAINVRKGWQKKDFFTDDHGDARIYGLPPGEYVVLAGPQAPIYFPDSPTRAGAHVISIRPWDDVNLEISMPRVRTGRRQISGRVVRWDGEPGHGSVRLSPDPRGMLYVDGFIDDTIGRVEIVDGEFTFANVFPGDFLIWTSLDDSDGSAQEARVTVDGDDISDLVITTVPRRR